MSKENKALAQKIVDKFSETIKAEHKASTEFEGDKDGTFYTCRVINVAGITKGFTDETEKGAKAQLVNWFASELDEGNLVLSDDWAANNLG